MRLCNSLTAGRTAARRTAVGTGLALSALVLTACGGSSKTPAAGSTGGGGAAPVTSTGSSSAPIASSAPLHDPAATPRPGAKGKKIVVISSGQASISSSVPVAGAVEAAKALGWSTTVYDEQLNPASAPGLVRQAIASGADGIVLDATDCPTVKGAMQEAKAKGIKIVGIYSFDCNDPIFGGGGEALFTGQINYGAGAADIDKFTQQYGADQAKAVIAATNGKANVVFLNDQEFTVLRYTGKGFLDEMAKCSGCKVVDKVDFTGAELGPNLQQKVTSALLQHPEANAIKSPYTAATLLGIGPAVVSSGRAAKIYSMGGEGFAPELDLLRANQGVSAVEITPSEWTAYAAVDTLNSLFTGKPAADSGLGWQFVDKNNGLPQSGPYVPKVDFKADYKKAWGV
jgi:ribose transport system substrate-binding protein